MSAGKRRDTRGRVLRSGETQRKDGRYRYTYYIKGKQYCLYSWKLEDTDRLPSGKRPCVSLRSQVKELNKSKEQGIAFRGNKLSVLELVEKYLAIQNANEKIRTATKAGYQTSWKHIREDSISSVRIDKIKKSDANVILFATGLRIAEFCGLTSDKVDMKNRVIKIDVQLHKDKQGYYLEKPKTKAGFRTVPMTDQAYESFSRLIQNRTKNQAEKSIGGQKNYLCFDRNDLPRYGTQWDKIFENIWKKYQKTHKTTMLKVTPHICRHTFATNMAIRGMNPAILKQILGHDDISTTFSIYTHIKEDNSIDEFQKLGLANMSKETEEDTTTEDRSKIINFASWIA